MSVVIISNALALFLYNMEVIVTEFWNSITHYAIFVWSCCVAALYDLLQPINWFNYTTIRQPMKVSSSSLKGQTKRVCSLGTLPPCEGFTLFCSYGNSIWMLLQTSLSIARKNNCLMEWWEKALFELSSHPLTWDFGCRIHTRHGFVLWSLTGFWTL